MSLEQMEKDLESKQAELHKISAQRKKLREEALLINAEVSTMVESLQTSRKLGRPVQIIEAGNVESKAEVKKPGG